MRRIQPVCDRRPLGRRQIEPRGPLRRPHRRGPPAKRNEGRLNAGIVRVDDKRQRLTQTIVIVAEHLLQNAAPLGHGATLLAGILAPNDEHRDRVGAVGAQRTRTRERRTQRPLCATHTIGQSGFLHASLGLLPILAPGEFPHRATTR